MPGDQRHLGGQLASRNAPTLLGSVLCHDRKSRSGVTGPELCQDMVSSSSGRSRMTDHGTAIGEAVQQGCGRVATPDLTPLIVCESSLPSRAVISDRQPRVLVLYMCLCVLLNTETRTSQQCTFPRKIWLFREHSMDANRTVQTHSRDTTERFRSQINQRSDL